MQDFREYGNGPVALLVALTELGIDPQLVRFIPYENEAVRGCTQTWQKMMGQQVARPQEEMNEGPYAPRVILTESPNRWRVVRALKFLAPMRRLLLAQGVTEELLTRIVLVEHQSADPLDVCMPHSMTPSPSFFFITVASREP